MALTGSQTLSPAESVSQYRTLIMGGAGGARPQPRSILNTAKVPYQAQTGSGSTAVFDQMKESAARRAPLYAQQAQSVRNQQSTTAPSSIGGGGYGQQIAVPQGPAKKGGVGTGAYGLTAQAGSRLQALQSAYKQAGFGNLGVNSGGRSYADQVKAYNNYLRGGNLAAKPGTSVHETGKAVDLNVMNSGSAQHKWLQANAPKFGWVWAGKNFSQVEPWHWEFRG